VSRGLRAETSNSLRALVAGASASVTGGLAVGIATIIVSHNRSSVAPLLIAFIGVGVVVLAVRLLPLRRSREFGLLRPLTAGIAAGLIGSALALTLLLLADL